MISDLSTISLSRDSITSLAATAVAYHLSDEDSLADRHLLIPEPDTDSDILSLLWSAAAGELAAILPDSISSDPTSLRISCRPLSEGRKHLIGESASAFISARMAAGWLRLVSRIEAAALTHDADQAAANLRTLLESATSPTGTEKEDPDAASPLPSTKLRLTMSPF